MSRSSTAVCELPLLPCIEYFAAWERFDRVVFDMHEHYVKQTYRNRCVILGANGPLALVVPTRHTAPKIPMHAVLIDDSIAWQRPFWKSILSAYGKAPFFEYFAHDIHRAVMEPAATLAEFNWRLLTLCLRCARLADKFSLSEKYLEPKDFDFIDLRSKISPKRPFGERSLFSPYQYTQNFGSEFVPNLSILDLIFCEGANTHHIIGKSAM